MPNFAAESPRLADYLRATAILDADHPAVKAAAQHVVSTAEDDVEQAQRLFKFVRDEISHTGDVGGGPVTCRASDVLRERTGICYAKSHLLAALLRAAGIPAGLCYQRLAGDGPGANFILHGFNGLYLASLDRWVRVDARGNKLGVDAQFDLQEERLAFAADDARGECTYPTIYVAPSTRVVDLLNSGKPWSDVWESLPGKLD